MRPSLSILRTGDPPNERKPGTRKKLNLIRANSFSWKAKCLDASPLTTTGKMGKSFSVSTIRQHTSRKSEILKPLMPSSTHLLAPMSFPPEPLKVSSLNLEPLKLPKTKPPNARRPYHIKKRFVNMSATLDRIPSSDWLSNLLDSTPCFSRVLQSNLERCRLKLSKAKIVTQAIREEDGDASERSSRRECCGSTSFF